MKSLIPDIWTKICYITIEKKGGSDIKLQSMIDAIDIDDGAREIDHEATKGGGRLMTIKPVDDSVISFTAYPLGISIVDDNPDLGVSQFFNSTSDTTTYLQTSPSPTPDLFRVTLLWTTASISNSTEEITQEAATSILADVITIGANTPPTSPTTGDRHVVGLSPTGAWATHANEIATWSGAIWTFGGIPTDKDVVYVVNSRRGYMYVSASTSWSTNFGFYQAYRYTIENAVITSVKKGFSNGSLEFKVMIKGAPFDENGDVQIYEWSVMGKNTLPSVDSILGAYV